MKLFKKNLDGWYCGYWNDSPLQIKYSSSNVVKKEPVHFHKDFSEYYFILKGKLILQIGTEIISVGKLDLLIVEAAEKHKILDKTKNCEYLIIKEKSYANNKF
jgi:mannose-6-phosphate isomerase-like protein (cupin superfamily)